ncbi:MAG TPA: LPS export ABC transporter periplasmic protein LptC [Parasegetibacter sp.]
MSTRNISAALLAGCFFLFGCENKDEEIRQLTEKRIMVEEAIDIESYLSQDGKVRARLVSPLMLRYATDSNYYEFPTSLQVDFLDSLLQVESKMTALYAKYYSEVGKVMLRDSIVVINTVKGDTLYCQELWWDQNTEMIYTEKPVRIRTKTETIDGTGMQAQQNFTDWVIMNPQGYILYPESGF